MKLSCVIHKHFLHFSHTHSYTNENKLVSACGHHSVFITCVKWQARAFIWKPTQDHIYISNNLRVTTLTKASFFLSPLRENYGILFIRYVVNLFVYVSYRILLMNV